MNLNKLSRWLKVFAEPKRLLIFNQLMLGVQCNCELGETLQMSPNLISHHLSKLRNVDLVEIEHDTQDTRWIYYSVNQATLQEFNAILKTFFNIDRIQPRHPSCGPQRKITVNNEFLIKIEQGNGKIT